MADNILVGSRKFLIVITSVILLASVVTSIAPLPPSKAQAQYDHSITGHVTRGRASPAQSWRQRFLQKLLSKLDDKHALLRRDSLSRNPPPPPRSEASYDAIPITLNLCDVSIEWRDLVKELEPKSSQSTGYAIGLMQDESYIYYNMLIGRSKDKFRFSDLTNGVVYKGFVKLLNNSYKVHHFIRGYDLYAKDSKAKEDGIHEFELVAPNIVSDENLLEQLEKASTSKNVTKNNLIDLEGVDLKVRFTKKIEKLGFLLEISKYSLGRAKNGNNTYLIVTPSQIIQLLPPIKLITLSHIHKNEIIRVTLKRISSVKENGDILMENVNYVNIYTGDVNMNMNGNISHKEVDSMRSVAELLENETASVQQDQSAEPQNDIFGLGFGSGLSQGFGDLFSSFIRPHSLRRTSVRCYANGDVFEGFACRNSDICIPIEWQCDGEEDCANGDDEFRCGTVNSFFNNNPNNYYVRGQCRRHEFRCRSRGQSLCLPNSWLCDGRVDCEDGWDEDEFNCGSQYSQFTPGHVNNFYTNNYNRDCADSWFNCWDNRDCIHPRYVCDNEDDCRDGSDERICASWNRQCDNHYEFRCSSSVGGSHASYTNRACIPKSWICDDQRDCPRGEDESLTMCRDYLREHPTLANDRPLPINGLNSGDFRDRPSPLDSNDFRERPLPLNSLNTGDFRERPLPLNSLNTGDFRERPLPLNNLNTGDIRDRPLPLNGADFRERPLPNGGLYLADFRSGPLSFSPADHKDKPLLDKPDKSVDHKDKPLPLKSLDHQKSSTEG